MKLWDFPRFSFVLQRKMVKFKSLPKCWQATHERYEAFLRRSKTFPSVSGEFDRTVPVKTAPLSARVSKSSQNWYTRSLNHGDHEYQHQTCMRTLKPD